MTKRFEQGHDEIASLCRYFAVSRAVFSGPDVNEAQVRQYLIDPLFEALGWDVGNAALVAYRKLLDHALAWYLDHKPENHPAAVHRNPRNNQWQLTITEKKRLLTTHIFGVDIDPQAAEVTKLSLLLKALEGESDATLAQQLQLFHTRALPNLAQNIQCGNALIGPDYFNATLLPDADEIKRVNPFDWSEIRDCPKRAERDGTVPDSARVPDSTQGGFDCVIGNPPTYASRPTKYPPCVRSYASYSKDFRFADHLRRKHNFLLTMGTK